ncbi:MAG: 4Fe-4S binding protein [Treponema sp.]|jgi:Pyruvate/2-oxoacid:ferredoxin oxidoreductase delta subunit|nr:4Fe-4S binding protein [Treponema sp.]
MVFGNSGFFHCFAVPDTAYPVIDIIVRRDEQKILYALKGRSFTAGEAAAAAVETGGAFKQDVAGTLYRRGLIIQTDGENEGGPHYRISDFYGRLDIFVRSELDTYRTFSEDIRRNLDRWYFSAYYSRLDIRPDKGPNAEKTLPLKETLEFAENESRQAYLALCDCRALAWGLYGRENCAKPMETCISYHSGPNTLSDMGISRPVSVDYVKEVIRDADRAGLMHRVNASGICNCCIDCCYQSRAMKRRNRTIRLYEEPAGKALWPYSAKRISVNTDNCAACGTCVKRCPFRLFTLNKSGISADTKHCAGCGLCVSTCPAKALSLAPRPREEL